MEKADVPAQSDKMGDAEANVSGSGNKGQEEDRVSQSDNLAASRTPGTKVVLFKAQV